MHTLDIDNPLTLVEYDLSPKNMQHEATPTVHIEDRRDDDFQVEKSPVAYSHVTPLIQMSLIDNKD